MATEVIVPYRGGCAHRERAWGYVRRRYGEAHPTWAVIEAPAPAGPWSKGAALAPALAASDADVVVVADADVWCEGIVEAVAAVAADSPAAAWAIPHRRVWRLTEAATAAYIAGAQPAGLPLIAEKHIAPGSRGYVSRRGGGIVVARREDLLTVPMDTRFEGWGQEDEAWGLALDTLVGRAWRGSEPLIHLYHPPADRLDRQWGSAEGRALKRRYAHAYRHRNAMRILIREARCSSAVS